VGELVVFRGASKNFADGDMKVHGQWGKVAGPSTVCPETKLRVRFVGNKGLTACYATELTRRHS
jgi:hypothetical protein